MKYTKKFMVVPYQEQSDSYIEQVQNSNDNKILSNILEDKNNLQQYNKYNETFKKIMYKKKPKQTINSTKDNEINEKLKNMQELINDILMNKNINNDSFYKPVAKSTRSKKNKTSKSTTKKKRSSLQKLSNVQNTDNELDNSIQNTLNTGVSETLDPEKFTELTNIIKNQISNEKNLLTDDNDNSIDNSVKTNSKKQDIHKRLSLAPKKKQHKRLSIKTKDYKYDNNRDELKQKWEHL